MRPVFEVDAELAIHLLDRVFLPEHEATLLTVRGLVIVALGGGGVVIKVHVPDALYYEAVVAEVFCGLNVVLVGVGPVELDLFTLVRDGVDSRLVATQAEKVTVLVIASEESIEVRVDLVFQRRYAPRLLQLGLQPPVLFVLLWIGVEAGGLFL